MRLKWILATLSAVVLLPILLLVVALVYLHSADLSHHRDDIAMLVSKVAGRSLSLNGDLDLNLSMTPSIVITKIALANASWASQPQMLTVERVEAMIELQPLMQGLIYIPRFHVQGVRSLVETRADGASNWALAESGDITVDQADTGRPAKMKLPWLGDVDISDVELRYHDAQRGQSITARFDRVRVSAAEPGSPIQVDINGQVDDHPVEINGTLALPTLLASGSLDIPIELHAKVLDITAGATGTVSGAADAPAIDLAVQVHAADLINLRQVFGDVIPDVKPVKLVMDINADQRRPIALKLNVIAGSGKLDTQLTLQRGGPRPRLAGKVEVNDIDVVRLWAPLFAGSQDTAPVSTAESQSAPSAARFDQPLAVDGLAMIDVAVDLSASNINLPQVHLKSLHSKIEIDDRLLTIDGLKLATAAGSVDAYMQLNGRDLQPDVRIKLNTSVIALGKLQPLAANKRLADSNAQAAVDLAAQGKTVAGLIDNVHGSVQLDYSDLQHRDKLSLKLKRKAKKKSAQSKIDVAAEGQIDGHALALSGNVMPPVDLLSRPGPYQVVVDIKALGVTSKLKGAIADAFKLDGIDLEVEAQARNLEGLRQVFGPSVPAIGKTGLATRVTLKQSKLRLSNLQASLDDSRIDGWVALDTAATVPDLQAELNVTDLNLDKLLPAAEKPIKPGPESKTKADRLFPDDPLPFDTLSRANVEATLRVSNLQYNNRRLQHGEFEIKLADGKLSASVVKFSPVKGELDSLLVVDASGNKTPTVMIKLKAPRIELAELLATNTGKAAIDGPLAADIHLQGQGNSVAQIMGTLNGNTRLLIEEGSADAEALDLFVGGLSAMFGTIFSEESSKTRIKCAICDLKLDNGVVNYDLAVLDTQYSTVFVEGQVNLKNEQLDMRVSPEAKGVTLSVAFPVLVKGTLTEPNVDVEKKGALLKTGELWATVAYPPAALVKFSDLGGGQQNPCVTMVAEKSGIPFVEDIGKVVDGTVKGVGGAVKDVGGVVKRAGSGLGKIFDLKEGESDSTTATDVDEEDDDFDDF